jgi:demethylmenaquinone methyltransferase/2-methoxy-6-polyprenyl-1,4-benzoquinol methylase
MAMRHAATASCARRSTRIRTGDKVLDVATGIGLVIGLDISAGRLALARRQAGLALVQANAEMLPIADGGFDMVTMGYALRHVGDLAGAFGDFHRVLRPGSVLVEIARPRSRTGHRLAWLYLKHSLPLASRLHLHGETSRLPRRRVTP